MRWLSIRNTVPLLHAHFSGDFGGEQQPDAVQRPQRRHLAPPGYFAVPGSYRPEERDPLLLAKITEELAVIVRHLMQRFANPNDARVLLQAQQSSAEALEIKRHADPLVDFCGYLTVLGTPEGMMIGNANITPPNPRRYLYHAYLSFMAARGYQHVMNLTAFGQAVPQTLKEYEHTLLKRRTKQEYKPT